MMDFDLTGEINANIKRVCKTKYKKGLFDFSGKWKEEYKRVQSMGYREIHLWLEDNDPERYNMNCQECGKDYIYIACPDYCVRCHEEREREGIPINGNHRLT